MELKNKSALLILFALVLSLGPVLAHAGHSLPNSFIEINLENNKTKFNIFAPMYCDDIECKTYYDYNYTIKTLEENFSIKNNGEECFMDPNAYNFIINESAGYFFYYLEYNCKNKPSLLNVTNSLFYEKGGHYFEQYYIINCTEDPLWEYSNWYEQSIEINLTKACEDNNNSIEFETKQVDDAPDSLSLIKLLKKIISFLKNLW